MYPHYIKMCEWIHTLMHCACICKFWQRVVPHKYQLFQTLDLGELEPGDASKCKRILLSAQYFTLHILRYEAMPYLVVLFLSPEWLNSFPSSLNIKFLRSI